MGVKIRLGCLGTLLLVLIAAFAFQRPILQRLFDDAYAKTTEMVVSAVPEAERPEARALCADLYTCFKSGELREEHTEVVEAFRTATFDMLKNQEVTPEEAQEHLERVRHLLDTACAP